MSLARLRATWRELFGVSLKPAPWVKPEPKPQERAGWDVLEDWSAWETSGTGRCPFCSRPYDSPGK